jgi:CubicO group peptidase (beta-lactamase class C family)
LPVTLAAPHTLCYNPAQAELQETILKATAHSPLLASFAVQDQIFSSAFGILREAIAQRAFPAASIAVTHKGKLVALKSFGKFTYEEKQGDAPSLSPSAGQGGDFEFPEVTSATLFDLASLTKPVATSTAAMLLHQRGLLELDAPIHGTVPEFVRHSDPRRREVTFRMLLAHCSGLPAYEKLFLKASTREDLLRAAFSTPLTADPGSRAEYSDIGFIILGVALEHIAQESLDAFCQREIFGPLTMTRTTFNPPAGQRPQIPPTADERIEAVAMAPPDKSRSTFRNRIIQGEVQDENASILGGVAGHAGLFSTAEDLARFAHAMLQGGNPILRAETIALFTQRQSTPASTTRTLGWDTPSSPSQSGKYFGPRSFGHLGYTGTSLWIDPDRQLSITLLTNRTWPDCLNQAIKQVRPRFHDAVIEALE